MTRSPHDRTARPRRHALRPRLDALEDRQLLTAGALDTATFNPPNGYVLTPSDGPAKSPNSTAYAVTVQSDGKLLAAGWYANAKTGANFGLARYHHANGSLDTAFGAGGKVATDFSGGEDLIRGLAIQGDGKVIAVGVSARTIRQGGTTVSDYDFALARYNTDGSLDASFGSGGKLTTAIGPGAAHDRAESVVIQPDGKIVVAGRTDNGASNWDFALTRYDASGRLDPAFGSGGKVITAMGPGADILTGMALQTVMVDGTPTTRIVVTGQVGGASGLALARYDLDGRLDPTFGSGGRVITPNGLDFSSRALAIQPDGRMVVVGMVTNGTSYDFGVARYGADGTLDTGFNPSGTVPGIATVGTGTADEGPARGAVVIQPDGRIVVAGSSRTGSGPEHTAVGRLNADGSADPSFGSGGIVVQALSSVGSDTAHGVTLQPDGKIVTAGESSTSSGSFMAVARFQGASGSPLRAASVAPQVPRRTLTMGQVRPALGPALAFWRARGADTVTLGRIDVVIADLGGDRLGEAAGSTITLDDDAAGWGWSPGRGRKPTTGRMDLRSALVHEVGHLLGHDHAEGGIMAETLAPGVRQADDDPGLVADPESGRDHPPGTLPRASSRPSLRVSWGRGRRPRAAARG